jgi:hypothetical protein
MSKHEWILDAYCDLSKVGLADKAVLGWVGLMHPDDSVSGDPDARWYARVSVDLKTADLRAEFRTREDAVNFVTLTVHSLSEQT